MKLQQSNKIRKILTKLFFNLYLTKFLDTLLAKPFFSLNPNNLTARKLIIVTDTQITLITRFLLQILQEKEISDFVDASHRLVMLN